MIQGRVRKKKAKSEKGGEKSLIRTCLVRRLSGAHFTSSCFVRTRTRSIVHRHLLHEKGGSRAPEKTGERPVARPNQGACPPPAI
ncbi:hypothetical protein BOX30_01735 [Leptospirillum ferriphilum]|nr:hypothetical protein BOX30_01735 [Leptospirillum ferriphilum]